MDSLLSAEISAIAAAVATLLSLFQIILSIIWRHQDKKISFTNYGNDTVLSVRLRDNSRQKTNFVRAISIVVFIISSILAIILARQITKILAQNSIEQVVYPKFRQEWLDVINDRDAEKITDSEYYIVDDEEGYTDVYKALNDYIKSYVIPNNVTKEEDISSIPFEYKFDSEYKECLLRTVEETLRVEDNKQETVTQIMRYRLIKDDNGNWKFTSMNARDVENK